MCGRPASTFMVFPLLFCYILCDHLLQFYVDQLFIYERIDLDPFESRPSKFDRCKSLRFLNIFLKTLRFAKKSLEENRTIYRLLYKDKYVVIGTQLCV